MRRMTYSPQYGLGRGRRTVACMSLVSSVGERVERVSPTDSLMGNIPASFQGLRVHSGPDPQRTMSRLGYPILSRNSSAALPMRFTWEMSRTVKSGWATYQPSAEIWYLTIQSFTCGLRIPGQPSHAEEMTSIWSVIFVAKSSI